jgi:predicted signal transduction protein with EAL and GGDEF domain
MVYGLVSLPLHHAFSLAGAWLALAAFTLFILACVVAKDRLVNWWKGSRLTPDRTFVYAGSTAAGVKP